MKLEDILDATVSLIGNEDEKIKREVEQHLHNLRAKYLSQHIRKHGISDWMNQTIVVPLEYKQDSPLCGHGCYALSANLATIPVRNTAISVRTLDGKVIPYISKDRILLTKHETYINNKIRFTILNDNIIILNNKLLKYVEIEAIFEYPHLLNNVTKCTNCGLDDEEYPIYIDYIPLIQQEIVNMYIRPQDEENKENIKP